MKLRLMTACGVLLAGSLCAAADAPPKLASVDKLPEGLAAPVAALMSPKGYSVVRGDAPVCEVWFAKELAVKPGFQPTLTVYYPLNLGTLVGVLHVPEKSEFSDFRGTPIPAGLYTLRYCQQPADGNHLGTSEVADFLLALPAKTDVDPKPISIVDQLHKSSAKASGTTHPAIFLLLPPEEGAEAAAVLTHEENRDLWILSVTAAGKDKDKKVQVPFRLVTIGKAEG